MTEMLLPNGIHNDQGHYDETRLDELLTSQQFRDEVEEIVLEQLHRSNGDSNINTHYNRSIAPISDLRGADALNYRKEEKVLRCKVAACYRLLDIHGLPQAYVSARNVPGQLLIAPQGLLLGEVTASSLVKINTNNGAVLDEGSTGLDVCRDELSLHSTLYSARSNINCVIHINSPAAITVSVLRSGLAALCHEAMVLGEISYHEYSGCIGDQREADSIKRTLGDNCQVLFLRGFGVVIVGETVEETYKIASNVLTATETQVNLLSIGIENLFLPTQDVLQAAYSLSREVPAGVNVANHWCYGEVEFEGLMRKLDNQGYYTGYIYRDGVQQMQRSMSVADSTHGKMSSLDERSNGIATPLNQLLMRRRQPDHVITPNVYWKEEADADTVDYSNIGSLKGKSRKIYRWVSTDALSNKQTQRSTSMKNLNQFAPQGSNPNELRNKVKEIRKEYFDDTITAGPQSTVLEGVTWEEARLIKEGQLINGGTNVRVTAASRGVIQREHQHEALFYKSYALNNPFDNVTQEDLEKYKRDVQKKSKKNYGKYAESEPEFLTERYPMTPIRATTPPAKPARLSPFENQLQSYTKQQLQSSATDIDEPEIRVSSGKPTLAAQPQPRVALSAQNLPNNADNRMALLDVGTDRSATLDNRSSKENSPDRSSTKEKKKKRGLRLPSFSKKNKQ